MMFSVVTPSFNALTYLPRCCASVADQGVEAEHLVMDGGSTDGTPGWLAARALPHVSARDNGMYDAINKGFDRARGEIVAHLNADEQYLPGTLKAVAAAFSANPGLDFVYGDALLVHPDGTLAAYRKAYPLCWPLVTAGPLYVLTCTLFYRRRVLESGLRFDTSFRVVSDLDFVLRLLRAGFRGRRIPRYQAAFTMTGKNLSLDARADTERARIRAALPAWVRTARPLLHATRLALKAGSGAYRQGPLSYALFADPEQPRQPFRCEHPSVRWKW